MVSEFMLQQTTVATVQPRFEAWMRRFPTIQILAAASEEAVLREWQGLGYYSRARRLHAAARAIAQYHGGILPSKKEELLKLPGIGDYTAEAILAFAYDLAAVVLDTNISRVIARWSNLAIPIDTAIGKLALREHSKAFFRSAQSQVVASALMDLGAKVCVAGMPRCEECPIRDSCRADVPALLPKKSPRAVTTKRTEYRAWIFQHGKLYLELSSGPLWKGLWILPELAEVPHGRCIAQLTYPITRYRVLMKVYPGGEHRGGVLKGFTPEELALIAVPSPHRRAIAKAGIPGHTVN
jgi:A/G-specific adenine glycosylase